MATILITGANRGLGLEFTRQYLAAGHAVIATSRTEGPDLPELAAAHPGRLSLYSLDVNDAAQATSLAAALAGTPIDVFVCNAGINSPPATIDAIDETGFLRVMQTNIMAPMRLVGLFADHVAASERKQMLFLGSRMGSMGANDRGGGYVYRASKAGLHAVVKSLSLDLAPRGITSVLVHPGAAKTAMAGARGTVEVADAVAGILAIMERDTTDTNGRFFNYTGEEIPW